VECDLGSALAEVDTPVISHEHAFGEGASLGKVLNHCLRFILEFYVVDWVSVTRAFDFDTRVALVGERPMISLKWSAV